jgi:hypothetical protein
MHLQAKYQLLVEWYSEATASQSAWTIAGPMPIAAGTNSNSRKLCRPHHASFSVRATLTS